MQNRSWIGRVVLGAATLIVAVGLAGPAPAQDAPAEATIEEKEPGQAWYVIIPAYPTTLEEFKALRDKLCTEPAGAMACFIVAMHLLAENEELGLGALTYILDQSLLAESINMRPAHRLPGADGWQISGSFVQMMKSSGFQAHKTYAARTYVLGTSKEDGYALPEPPYRYYVRIHRVPPREGEWKGFLNTSGNEGGGAVPFILKRNSRGVWKMLQASSFFVGYARPTVHDDGDDR